jgi:hypothetical protein
MTFISSETTSNSIALLAFFFTVFAWYYQKNKDKRDKEPLFTLIHSWNDRQRKIEIKNKGLGKAIITKITLHYKDKKEIPLKPYSDDDDDPTGLFGHGCGFYIDHGFNNEHVLDIGEKLLVISINSHLQHGRDGILEIINKLKKIDIEITYKTTYSNKEYLYTQPASNHCDYDISQQ